MKSLYEFNLDGEVLYLFLHPEIRKHFPHHRIVWNHKGMRGVIPPPILEAQYALWDEYKSRLRALDEIPPSVGVVSWDAVVPIPPHDPPLPDRTDEDA